jgi:hypothetical protein
MKPQSYSQEDISKAVIELVGRSQEDSTPIQKRGITKLKSYGSWNLCEPENMNGLRNFFSIFDDVFFNGVLTGYCSVSFPAPARTGWYAGVNAYCRIFYPVWEQDPRFKIEKPRIEICIMPGDSEVYKDYHASYRIRRYQRSLIHEMLRAVFGIYTCYCESCNEKNCLLPGNHDEWWLAAPHTIKQADRSMKNGESQKVGIMGVCLGLDLDKSEALIRHWDYIPPNNKLRRVGLDIKQTRKKLVERREIMATSHRADQQQGQLRKANRCVRLAGL